MKVAGWLLLVYCFISCCETSRTVAVFFLFSQFFSQAGEGGSGQEPERIIEYFQLMWGKEVRGSNNCLLGLTRLELNHRKNCWKSQISFLSETEKYPLPASGSGQHFGPSRAQENLILLIAAVDFLRNFSTILCTGLIFQPLRESLHFPWGLEEAEKIMAGAGFWLQIYTFHIPASSGNNSTVCITQNSKGREVIFFGAISTVLLVKLSPTLAQALLTIDLWGWLP